jgi:ubiquinone/menaquinone biosynthesis C-methylase UbiE
MTPGSVLSAVLPWGIAFVLALYVVRQAKRPDRMLGRLMVSLMNRSHSGLTDWGLRRVMIEPGWRILDVGCGGGRTIQKLAALAPGGTVAGVDYADGSVATSRWTARRLIAAGRVSIEQASADRLPFPDREFDLVTAVETHFYWPNLPNALAEIRRVLKPGGIVLLIAESYAGGPHDVAHRLVMRVIGSTRLTVREHHDLLTAAGYEGVSAEEEPARGWITVVGRKPA